MLDLGYLACDSDVRVDQLHELSQVSEASTLKLCRASEEVKLYAA